MSIIKASTGLLNGLLGPQSQVQAGPLASGLQHPRKAKAGRAGSALSRDPS